MTEATENDQPSDDAQILIFRIVEERLKETVQREEEIDYRSARDNQRTQLIGRISLLGVLLLTPPVFYLIWTLVLAMGVITDRMQAMRGDVAEMRTSFDEVALRVNRMDDSVARMSAGIAVIPPMERRVAGMRRDYDVMVEAMGRISPNVGAIDSTLAIMDLNVGHMSHVLGFVNRDVILMRRDVNRMSSPMRMIPFFGQ